MRSTTPVSFFFSRNFFFTLFEARGIDRETISLGMLVGGLVWKCGAVGRQASAVHIRQEALSAIQSPGYTGSPPPSLMVMFLRLHHPIFPSYFRNRPNYHGQQRCVPVWFDSVTTNNLTMNLDGLWIPGASEHFARIRRHCTTHEGMNLWTRISDMIPRFSFWMMPCLELVTYHL